LPKAALIFKFVTQIVNYKAMNISDNIKRVREAKNLTQKEVIMAIDMGAAMYSRIESGKIEPSLTTLEKIAKALGVSLVELIQSDESLSDVNSVDKSLMEKVWLMEALNDEERKIIYTMLDAFIGKKNKRTPFRTFFMMCINKAWQRWAFYTILRPTMRVYFNW